MSTPSLTLYTSKISPYALRVEICLAQAHATYQRCEMDIMFTERPEWYMSSVNPTGQVPVIACGGPAVPPDQPSPESVKLRESNVLVEFVADLYPDSGLLPADPVGRAKARFFIDIVNTKFAYPYVGHLHGDGTPLVAILPGLQAIQAMLPADKTFALGDELTAADASVAPFLLHLPAFLNARDTEGVGAALHSEKLARLSKYYQALKEHPSVISTYDEAHVYKVFADFFREVE